MRQSKAKPKSFLKRWGLSKFSLRRIARSAIAIHGCGCLYAWFSTNSKIGKLIFLQTCQSLYGKIEERNILPTEK